MEYDPIQGLTSAITRIEDKLDKHDEKFDMIATTLQKLVAVDIELRTTKESITHIWDEVRELKDNQTSDGCPAHKNFVKVREEQLKGYDKLAIECKEMHNKLLVRIETIEEKPKTRIETAIIEVIKWVTVFIMGSIALKLGVTK